MRTQCPNCGQFYRVKDEHAGKTTRCKKCGVAFAMEEIIDLAEGGFEQPDNDQSSTQSVAPPDSAPQPPTAQPTPPDPTPKTQEAAAPASLKIVRCLACQAQISTEALSCPHCGQPINEEQRRKMLAEEAARQAEVARQQAWETKKKRGCGIGCLGLIVILVIVGKLSPHKEPSYDKDYNIVHLVPDCVIAIERAAKYDYDWASIVTVRYKFPRSEWLDKNDKTIIRLYGANNRDALRFKNAFGVWVPMKYTCDINVKTKQVVDFTVEAR
jgi:predicted Zn finger-like uncharacterized protein